MVLDFFLEVAVNVLVASVEAAVIYYTSPYGITTPAVSEEGVATVQGRESDSSDHVSKSCDRDDGNDDFGGPSSIPLQPLRRQ